MKSFSTRAAVAPSVFGEISALARAHKAVNLGQGFPDFDGPEFLIEEAYRAMQNGKNQYSIPAGELVLRQAIAEHSERFYGQKYNPDTEITVTNGVTQGLYATLLALLSAGDEVIVFEPCYDSYVPAITAAGGLAVPVALSAPHFTFDSDELRAACSLRTKAIIVNTPHNPTGKIFSHEELQIIAQIAEENDAYLICDEVYEHITFAPQHHQQMSSIPEARSRTIVLSSIGKTFSMTGWKIGWILASEEISRAVRAVHQFMVFAVATPLQYAAVAALRADDSFFEQLRREYSERKDYMMQTLSQTLFEPISPHGSYFIMANYQKYSSVTSDEFAKNMIKSIGLAVIPPASFYLRPHPDAHQFVRFAFCKKPETLAAAREILWQSNLSEHLAEKLP